MDELGNAISGPDTALVILAFLQADCSNAEYGKELVSLRDDIHPTWDINRNGLRTESQEDGDLETDGHLCSNIWASLGDNRPSLELGQRDRAEAGAFQQVVQGLRDIAAQLEHNVMAQATLNLDRRIRASPSNQWKEHLMREVDEVMLRGVGLEHLPQERVFMAVTLTLVKAVCERAPRALRSLFHIALQYIGPVRAQ